MENKVVRVQDCTQTVVQQALQQWLNLYANQLPDDFSVQLHSEPDDVHYLKVDNRIKQDLFFYLVNYLTYPERLESKPKVEGLFIAEKGKLKGVEFLIYVPEHDQEYDNVYGVSSGNQHFKFDFGGRTVELSDGTPFTPFDWTPTTNPKIFQPDAKQESFPPVEHATTEKWNRFNILLSTLVIAGVINYILVSSPGPYTDFSGKLTFFIPLGVFMWFFLDYQMLQSDFNYLKCLGIAVGLIAYMHFILPPSPSNGDKAALFTYSPLILLAVQRPLRLAFITLYKREPNTLDSRDNWKDSVYSMLLFLAPILASLVLSI